jgi:hypothetical protein
VDAVYPEYKLLLELDGMLRSEHVEDDEEEVSENWLLNSTDASLECWYFGEPLDIAVLRAKEPAQIWRHQ